MSRTSSRPPLLLEPDVAATLAALAVSRTAPARDVERARMMLDFARGLRIADIARGLAVSRDAVEECLARAVERGPIAALRDRPGRGRPRSLTPEAKTWVVELACIKPKDLGYAAELWTHAALAKHVHAHCAEAGHPSLSRLGSGTVSKILAANQVQPHRIEYYLERRDPEFETKRAAVLAIYQEVELLRAVGAGDVAVISYGEKPGIQALQIRVVLDNHTAHGSRETMAYLATRPGRFDFTFTPKHGSWLNLVEAFFAKMARTMLRGIRVQSKAELKSRIEMWLLELNEDPVLFRWKHGLDALAMASSA